MDEERKKQLEDTISGMWDDMESSSAHTEDTISAEDANEDRLALGRRIGRMYLSFARILIDRLGEEEGRKAILEAIKDYSMRCSEARKRGMVDLPRRGIHQGRSIVETEQGRRLRTVGCSIATEFADQDEQKLGALYCYVDPCSFMMTLPNIKLYHTEMEPFGADFCEFDLGIASDEEMQSLLDEGGDYQDVDPIIKEGTKGPLLKSNQG